MTAFNRKAAERRRPTLGILPEPWAPDLPAEEPPYEQTFAISAEARYIQRFGQDAYGRLVEWAVIQERRVDGRWLRVAVYDTCHGKGVHVHHYDGAGEDFLEHQLLPVTCHEDLETGLQYALERVAECWQENERRSDRGR